MFRIVSLFAVSVVVLVSGCAGGGLSLGYYDQRPVERTHVYVAPEPVHVSRIPVDHVCGEHCYDHFYNGNRVVVLSGHRHGHDCGHRWDGYNWVTLTARRIPSHREPIDVHVCTENCYDHYYDGSRTIAISGHRHGYDCGHRWNGRHWVVSVGSSLKRSHDAKRIAPHPVKRKANIQNKRQKLKKSKGHH